MMDYQQSAENSTGNWPRGPDVLSEFKKDIKEAVKAAMKKKFLEEMQSSVKVKDRLSDDPEEQSYIN